MHDPTPVTDLAGLRPMRFIWSVALAAGLVLPVVALLGVQKVEESYLLEEGATEATRLEIRQAYRAPGRFGLRLSSDAAGESLVVEYRAVGLSWLARLLEGPPIVGREFSMFAFRSAFDPVGSLPALCLLAALSWRLASPLARRSVGLKATTLHSS